MSTVSGGDIEALGSILLDSRLFYGYMKLYWLSIYIAVSNRATVESVYAQARDSIFQFLSLRLTKRP